MTAGIRRPVLPGEVGQLTSIWKRAVETTHHFLTPAHIAAVEVGVRTSYLPRGGDVWVAVDAADVPQAFLGLSGHHIDALYVDPDAQSTGIGTSLLRFAIALHPELTLDVNEQNPLAHDFYLRRGFVDVRRSPLDEQGRPFPMIYMRRPG